MTYQTDKKNEFKKDPLRGLEYKNADVRPFPIVQAVVICFLLILVATCVKMCNTPEQPSLTQLNADRR